MRTVLLLLFASAICVFGESFSQEGKLNVLNIHNEFRSQLALGEFSVRGIKKPAACGMRKMASLAPKKWWQEFETNGWDSLIYNHAIQRFKIGHAIQMAWHSTNKVGCGYAKCAVGTPDQTMVVVCRYHQKGNIEGEPIYEQGVTCSKCPAEYQKCPFGLCEKEGVDSD
uniref:SCP domain-containing protein n=1 Tax=Caenorhabditis tropicalis TaxID=1561998 RepID=A0A1I7TDR2_9PELO